MEYLELENARSWIQAAALLIAENASMLTELDTAIGDGDHGENMMRGFKAIDKKLHAAGVLPSSLADLFKLVGMTLLSSVGGAAGPLYGGFFLALSKASAGREKLSKAELGQVLSEGLADIQRRGKAQLGDKTMVDALSPAIEAFCAKPDGDLAGALQAAAAEARRSAEATIPLQARKGRASYLAERSIGHQDPGATSTWLLLRALASVATPNS
ncbi:MAG TPA: dihydroxyacetone kinase subunit DhaL [Bryocella sp.]|nr:dihydroxyacetone kinase subunit DhaL [Bryocella sp.]